MYKKSYKRISQEGDFILYAADVPYRIYRTINGYYRNVNTGENCGTEVVLYKHYYHEDVPLDEPEYDEFCYELVKEAK